jgi:hypothetical protein
MFLAMTMSPALAAPFSDDPLKAFMTDGDYSNLIGDDDTGGTPSDDGGIDPEDDSCFVEPASCVEKPFDAEAYRKVLMEHADPYTRSLMERGVL